MNIRRNNGPFKTQDQVRYQNFVSMSPQRFGKGLNLIETQEKFHYGSINFQKIVILQKNNYLPKMSITVSNCYQICNSPSNASPSKMLYSFSKTARFSERKVLACDRYYDLPSTVNNCRTTSLGFGHKYNFTQEASKNPPPNTYNIKSTFSLNKTQGFGFGKGRQEMEVTGPLASVRINKNPGPSSYNLESTLSKSAYSLTGKSHQQDKERLKIPGPGTYPVVFCINEKGDYFLSKYKNSCTRNFSKICGRSDFHINRIPGPGSYDTSHVDLSPKGKYVSSKLQNCLTRTFAITTRKPMAQNNENPGPGNYKLPSEFGHYIARRVFLQKKNIKQFKSRVDKKKGKEIMLQKAGRTQQTTVL